MKSIYYWMPLLLLAAGCGSDKDPSLNANFQNSSESYSYQFRENGCDTGVHKFSSLSAYCDGLADHGLNKGCALTLRRSQFKSKCPGRNFPDSFNLDFES